MKHPQKIEEFNQFLKLNARDVKKIKDKFQQYYPF